ncbi:SAG family member, partial [Eimeria necatrix]
MARVAFFSLVSVPLLFNQTIAQQKAATPEAQKLDCLEAMNGLRTAAGLAEFKEASIATQVLPEKTVERATDSDETTQAGKLTGTFAYYPVADGKKDCNAAVEYWKAGFSLFKNELPPEFTETNKTAVYSDKAVSFVALYNPKPNPVVSCVLLQCPTATVP